MKQEILIIAPIPIIAPCGRGMTKLVRSLPTQLVQSGKKITIVSDIKNEKTEGEERTFEKDEIPQSCINCKYIMKDLKER